MALDRTTICLDKLNKIPGKLKLQTKRWSGQPPRLHKDTTFLSADNKPFQMLDEMWWKVSQEVLCCDL